MILQELIRNIVLYKGFVQPLVQLVREHMVRFYSTSHILSQPRGLQIEDIKALSASGGLSFSLSPATGTRTIPNPRIIIWNVLNDETEWREIQRASDSSMLLVVLVDKDVDKSMQTNYLKAKASRDLSSDTIIYDREQTTGLLNRNTYLYFSHETHEKREYLGEFSLPHEENRFNSLSDRR